MKRPLLPVALCYVGGLLLAEALQPPLPLLFGVAFALLIPALLWNRARPLLTWPLLVIVGWTNLVSRTAVLSPHDLRHLLGGAPALVTVRGTLEQTPSLRVYQHGDQETVRSLVPVRVAAMARRDQWQPAHGRIMVTTKAALPDEFFAGREVLISGVLAPPPAPVAPGLFDYRAYLAHQGIHYQLKADGAYDWQVAEPADRERPFTDRFLAWAQGTLARGLPEQDEPLRLMWAMTLGWKTALSGEINEPFMRSGTMHIFAISGLHIALIAGILVSLLRVARVPRMWCGLVVIPLIWFYTAATGWQSSAIRSTVMMTIIIGGWSLRRPSDLLNSLAAAGLVILLWDPQQLFQASFQLSFFVVLSIALFLPPLEKWRDRVLATDPLLAPGLVPKWQLALRTAARWVLTSFATSLAAWLGALPLTAYYFHLFSPVTLLANLLIVPMSSAALACNLGSLICGGWLPWATELFNHCGWFWMLGMVRLSQWSTELPGAYFYVAPPSAFTFLIYYGFLVGTMSGWLWKPGRRWRSSVALLLVGGLHAAQCFASRHDVELTILPLNGGHAEYCDAAGKADDWLMDCGNTNAVEFITQPFLRAKGVNHLPRLLFSHGDLQHVGGAALLAAELHCREIAASSFRFRSTTYRRLFADFQRDPCRLRTIHRGDQVGQWHILHPTATDESSQADDGALVRQAEIHGAKVLLLSDLGRAGQNLLLERSSNHLRADIVVTGIPTQTDPLCEALLDAIRPRVIIVADSELPATARASERLKARLTRRNLTVLNTRDTGAVTILFRPAGCEITTTDRQHFSLKDLPAMKFPPPPAEEAEEAER
jgi:competence protein ComEC